MAPNVNYPSEDPFKSLKDRIHEKLKGEKIDEQIIGLVQEACLALLKKENILLSRVEKKRLFQAILKDELNDILARM